LQQVVDVLVAAGDERGVGGMEGDPRPGQLPHPAGEAVVVGVDVGDEHAADVLQPGAERAEAVAQRRQRLRGVPAGVDQHHPVRHLEGVGEHVGQWAARDGHRDAPQSWPDLLHGRGAVAWGLRLR
jgi:hypothetical protein